MHVKLENNEILNTRKIFLSSQIELLKSIQKIRDYKILRKQETALKMRLKSKLKKMNFLINKINSELPEPSKKFLEEIKQLEAQEKKQEQPVQLEIKEVKKDSKMLELEKEILDIKSKLAALE